jgi:small subunit ribosomal protein S20
MANIKSAKKRIRQAPGRAARNRKRKSTLWTHEKSFNAAVESGDAEAAQAAFNKVVSAYDKALKVGVIHKNRVNRKKSQFKAALNKLS